MAETDNVSRTTLTTKSCGSPSPSACDAAPPLEKSLVLTSDRNSSRLNKINLLIEQCGGQSLAVTDPARATDGALANCGIAVIAMGAAGPSASEFRANVLKLKQSNFKVLAYEEGAQSLPLGLRCQALLCGCAHLLDSSLPNFDDELQAWLQQEIRAQTASQQELEHTRGLMRQMGIVGESGAILSAFRLLGRVSGLSDVPVLLTGETGTGKELFAQAIYRLDPKRRHGPFVALNCGALNASLAESELFGHRRGAFTGAEQSRKGLVRTADRGVLFLDEIGELDAGSQAKLLRVLQENRVLSLGEDREVDVSIRVIAATNRRLDEMVREGIFRQDLFHRLNVVSISIPPLRERPADLCSLTHHFLDKYSAMVGGQKLEVREDFVSSIAKLDLPGNVRELENLIRKVLVNKSDHRALDLVDLPEQVWQMISQKSTDSVRENPQPQADEFGQILLASGSNLTHSLRHCERMLVEAALLRAHGNQAQTARLLGITPRSVYNKMRKYNLQG
jgi:transcriptional regulator with GAF, ATPase, and Fis domain